MGALATASLFIVSMLCMQSECNSEVFKQNQRNLPEPSPHHFYLLRSRVPEQQSASNLQSPNRLRFTSTNYLLGNVKHDQNFPSDNSNYYENLEKQVERNVEQTHPQTFSEPEDANHKSELEDSYEDYKTAQSSYLLRPQFENIQSDQYYGKVRAYDDEDDYKQEHHEKHKEVHYHKHQHHHKHEHKQEHKHHHKQGHEHKHMHEQHHKHEHHQEHKHGHEHKHDHHQHHKHDHHHGHKHGHHHDHKHGHKHGHKHEHHNEHKHHHKHGHKHGHKHEHKHHTKHHH